MPELAVPVGYRLQPQTFTPINPASYFNKELPVQPPIPVDKAAKAQVFGALMKTLGELPGQLTKQYEDAKDKANKGAIEDNIRDKFKTALSSGSDQLYDFKVGPDGAITYNPEDPDIRRWEKEHYKNLYGHDGKPVKKSLYDTQSDLFGDGSSSSSSDDGSLPTGNSPAPTPPAKGSGKPKSLPGVPLFDLSDTPVDMPASVTPIPAATGLRATGGPDTPGGPNVLPDLSGFQPPDPNQTRSEFDDTPAPSPQVTPIIPGVPLSQAEPAPEEDAVDGRVNPHRHTAAKPLPADPSPIPGANLQDFAPPAPAPVVAAVPAVPAVVATPELNKTQPVTPVQVVEQSLRYGYQARGEAIPPPDELRKLALTHVPPALQNSAPMNYADAAAQLSKGNYQVRVSPYPEKVAAKMKADYQQAQAAMLPDDKNANRPLANLGDKEVRRGLAIPGKYTNPDTAEVSIVSGWNQYKTRDPITGMITMHVPDGRTFELLPGANQWRKGETKVIDDDLEDIAQGIVRGEIPPDMTRYAGKTVPLTAKLARMGYNLADARKDWTATQRALATMNGQQQLKVRQAVDNAAHQLDIIEGLGREWAGGRFPLLNRAQLSAARNGLLGPKAQSIAQRFEGQINDLVSELGNVYQGGGSPTNHSLELAAGNLKADFSEQTLMDSINTIRQNLMIRSNSLDNVRVAGTGDNPYYQPQGGSGSPMHPPAAGGEAPAAPSKEDQQALQWLRANPNDARAAKIKAALQGKGIPVN